MQFLVLFLTFFGLSAAQNCVYDKDAGFPTTYEPLIVDFLTWIPLMPIMQGASRVVQIQENSDVVIGCPESVLNTFGTNSVEATCVAGQLEVTGTPRPIMDFECSARARDTVVENITDSCGDLGAGYIIRAGFKLDAYLLVTTYEVCFEQVNDLALYTTHILYSASIEASDGNPDKPSFKSGSVYGYDPNECYLTANQDGFWTSLTGDADYIDLNSNRYYSRGHLAPNADFLTDMIADSSYYYINAMPQWQEFNGGNWMYFEGAVRDKCMLEGTDFQIWTGPGLTITEYNQIDVYQCDSQGSSTIPIPMSIWKVVYDPIDDSGIAVIMSNEPYQTVEPSSPCTNLNCSTIGWIDEEVWFPYDLENGYMICCTVQDWYAVNPNAPDLPTATLLL